MIDEQIIVNDDVLSEEEMYLLEQPLTELELLEMISGALIEINWKITAFMILWIIFKMWGGARKL